MTKLARIQPQEGSTFDDGDMLVTKEQLERFGGGDAQAGRRELRMLLAESREGPVLAGPTPRPQSVRLAGPQDEEALVQLLLLDLKENGADQIAPVDEEKILNQIQVGTRRRGGLVGVIDDKDGKPIAIVILHPANWWWSCGWYWFEVVRFVHSDHRRSHHANDLIDWAKWASDAQSKGMGYRMYLVAGILGTWRVHAKVAQLRRKIVQCGSVHVYPAPPVIGK